MEANAKSREKAGFLKRLSVHNKPPFLIFTGLIFGMIAGSLLPVFGIFYAYLIMNMTNEYETSIRYGIYLSLFAPISFVVIYVGRGSWAYLAENMTKNIRA